MALDAQKTGEKIAKITTAENASEEMKLKIKTMWADIMSAIYDDIKADSQITVAAGIPVATAGSQTAQTGATTATGTATIA